MAAGIARAPRALRRAAAGQPERVHTRDHQARARPPSAPRPQTSVCPTTTTPKSPATMTGKTGIWCSTSQQAPSCRRRHARCTPRERAHPSRRETARPSTPHAPHTPQWPDHSIREAGPSNPRLASQLAEQSCSIMMRPSSPLLQSNSQSNSKQHSATQTIATQSQKYNNADCPRGGVISAKQRRATPN